MLLCASVRVETLSWVHVPVVWESVRARWDPAPTSAVSWKRVLRWGFGGQGTSELLLLVLSLFPFPVVFRALFVLRTSFPPMLWRTTA